MMTFDQIVPIAIQLPIVFLFIWYSDRKDKQFMDFLREEREARQRYEDANVNKLTVLASVITDFRAETTQAIKIMQDRTRRGDDPRNVRE